MPSLEGVFQSCCGKSKDKGDSDQGATGGGDLITSRDGTTGGSGQDATTGCNGQAATAGGNGSTKSGEGNKGGSGGGTDPVEYETRYVSQGSRHVLDNGHTC